MTYRLFINSTTGMDIEPEWDFQCSAKKIESRHRTKAGYEYVYRWADYKEFSFTISYVSSANACIVNSWWNSNAELKFMEEGSTDISSVRIVNATQPMDKKIKPYPDLYTGTIKLSTY